MGQATINDVARVAGVSKKTVSRVINRSPLLSVVTRARVEAVIAELRYVPSPQARALALRRNFLVALAYAAGEEERLGEVVRGMTGALAGGEFALLLRPLAIRAEAMAADFRRFLDEHRPYGAALLGRVADNPALPPLAHASGCRLALLGGEQDATDDPGTGPAADYPRLVVDVRAAAAAAVGALVALGHRRIGLVVGPEHGAATRASELGFLDGLAEHALDRGAALIAVGDDDLPAATEHAGLLLEISPPPTAIVAGGAAGAAGVLAAAAARGLAVPSDLSVITLADNTAARHARPPLSALAPPLAKMAYVAARALADPAYAPPAAAFAAEPIARGSTAPPRELELVNPLPAGRRLLHVASG